MKKIMWVISIAACLSACNQSPKTEPTESSENQNTQTQNVSSPNIANQDLSTVEVEEHWEEEHWDEEPEVMTSDEPPLEIQFNQQFDHHFNYPYLQLSISAVVDEVEIHNVTVNRGNTCQPKYWQGHWAGYGKLKFGQSVATRIRCDAHMLKEVSVDTNFGPYTYQF